MSFSLDSRGHSEIGPVRKSNQDSGYISANLLIIADGMGGAAAGDVASATVIREIQKIDRRFTDDQAEEVMSGSLAKINDTVSDMIAQNSELAGMGSTMTGALFTGNKFLVTNIGDSRSYLFRDGKLSRLTHDDSLVQSLIDDATISEAEAAHHPQRSLLLKVINGKAQHDALMSFKPAQLGDRLLICSDGLCGFVSDEQLADILATENIDDVVELLVQAAYQQGTSDNVSFIVSDVVEQNTDLDQIQPQILGAANEIDLTKPVTTTLASVSLGKKTGRSKRHNKKSKQAKNQKNVADAEQDRYAPVVSKRRWLIPIVSSILAVVLLGGGGYFAWRWSQTQYYVGENNDRVTIFRGIPGKFAGIEFSSVYEEQPILVADLPRHYREKVDSTITVKDLTAARQTVSELSALADYCIEQRKPKPAPPEVPADIPGGNPKVPSNTDISSGATPTDGTSPSVSMTPGPTTPRPTSSTIPVPTPTSATETPEC